LGSNNDMTPWRIASRVMLISRQHKVEGSNPARNPLFG